MRFLIAPDKFKGALSARAVAENIALGIHDVLPAAEIEIAPVADGGEGTAEIICSALDGEWMTCAAHDALGRPIEARYGWMAAEKRAVMEMSEAAGLRQLGWDERDPMRASTYGVGEMILAAARRGAGRIMVGLGGSATMDGGLGMARALGFRFEGVNGVAVETVSDLAQLTRIIRAQVSLPALIGAADVRNPLLGVDGAARVYGPQKGATGEQVELIDKALARLADIVARDLGVDARHETRGGAAGGLGFGLRSFCEAQLRGGFDLVAEEIGMKKKISAADIVITGEGRLDAQTLEGKAPAGVAELAREKRVFAIVGAVAENSEVSGLFEKVFTLVRPGVSQARAMKETGRLLRECGAELAHDLG